MYPVDDGKCALARLEFKSEAKTEGGVGGGTGPYGKPGSFGLGVVFLILQAF